MSMGDEKRFFLFLVLTTLILIMTPRLVEFIWGPVARPVPKPAGKQAEKQPDQDPGPDAPERAVADQPDKPEGDAEADKPPEKPAGAAPELDSEFPSLGSLDPQSGFKMKLDLSSRGATVRHLQLIDYLAEDRRGPLQLLSASGDDEGSFRVELKGTVPLLAERNWQVIRKPVAEGEDDQVDSVRFQTMLTEQGLEIAKTYRLRKGSFTFELELEVRNQGTKSRELAYRLGGPRGMVLEGAWYATKKRDAAVSDGMGADLKRHTILAAALVKGADKIRDLADRDGAISQDRWPMPPDWFDRFDRNRDGKLLGSEIEAAAHDLAGGERERWVERPLRFAGVEGQYFCVLLVVPPPEQIEDRWDAATAPVLVQKDRRHADRSDVSVEMESKAFTLDSDHSIRHAYTVYAGPRKQSVLEAALPDPALVRSILGYQGALLVFPAWLVSLTASTMLSLLQFFHGWVANWGVAIIMLTVLVRMLMFPLSRKQALAGVKMQALKPELDALREKYKNDKEKMSRAQMELWRKHGVHPLGGCLPVIVQMPIFIGLWQGLSSSVDLRQATFLWIDNLAAPDGPSISWFHWGENIPLVSHFLGPYFNLLPTVLIGLMLVQQKMFMPPKTDSPDPQVEMQQKMATYMMLFFGFIFWRLPSGLCVYYIASTLWGITERKFLPKFQHATQSIGSTQAKEKLTIDVEPRPSRARKASSRNGMTWKERLQELIKRAEKR